MRILALGVVMALLGTTAAKGRQDWKPAPCPIPTKWAGGVTPENVWPEYPRPRLVRDRWMNLNGLWQWGPCQSAVESTPTGRDLPGRILVPFPIESSLSGVGKRAERMWYRRMFEVPEAWRTPDAKGERPRVLLHFGAVDWEAEVFVNDKHVGIHAGGYNPFAYDITDALVEGKQQELIVRVYDPTDGGTQPRGKQVREPKGIFYTSTTGIWQTVWLEPVPRRRIDDLRITADIEKGDVTLTVFGAGLDLPPGDDLREDDFEVEATVTRNGVKVGSGKRAGLGTWVTLQQPALWSPETPNLYDVNVEVRRKNTGELVDRVRSYFGMRTVSIGKDDRGVNRLFLNGKPYFQVGLLDQGFWPDGLYTAPSDEAMKFDIEQTKALGFNLIRKHVKVEPERWYTWCDRLGVLVWQDMPSGDASIGPNDPDIKRSADSAAQYEGELAVMIGHLWNYPCIIMWVPFNEGWGQFDTARIAALVKSLDPTRLVNSATGWTDRGVGDVLDIHSYPGPDSPLRGDPRTEEGRKQEPVRAAVLGEFGGLGLAVPGHTWSKESWGYQGMADRDELTERYVSLLERVHELKETRGLSAVVYTQTTDVETECNGLMTYDRALVKMDAGKVLAANQGRFPKVVTTVPCAASAEGNAVEWRYTTKTPGAGSVEWYVARFDDSSWSTGRGGFGTEGTPGAIIGTKWDGDDIWLRREFEVGARDRALDPGTLRLLVHHDEDAEVYINGVLGAKLPGYTTGYVRVRMSPEAAGTLKAGRNMMAVHCHQTRGGQYIDVGIVEVVP